MTMDPKRGGHTLRERDRGAEMGGQTHNEERESWGRVTPVLIKQSVC